MGSKKRSTRAVRGSRPKSGRLQRATSLQQSKEKRKRPDGRGDFIHSANPVTQLSYAAVSPRLDVQRASIAALGIAV
jgi:hypothetical protein